MKTISNKQLTIQVSPHGAELCSIVANGKEYLWQADPAFWKRHSPVLFPIVGSVWENEYRNEGIPYTLTQHGFARDMEFMIVAEKEDEVRYRLVSNEETLKKYPKSAIPKHSMTTWILLNKVEKLPAMPDWNWRLKRARE